MAIGWNGSGGRGLFARLLRNEAGNMLMLTAALLIPLTALIGSGIDLGRIYVARERIQVACDAASLAGRRAVSAGASTATVQAEAAKFFNYNFPSGAYGTNTTSSNPNPATFSVSVNQTSPIVVTVTATTALPMSVMTIFGNTSEPISVTCNAQQDFVNTDVVLVLDNTGSMLCTPSQTSCSNSNETSNSKIVAMRSAVMALYDSLTTAQTQLQAAGLRLRYSVVPFTSTVNIGRSVYGLNTSYIRNPAPYWQRVQVCTGSGNNRSCSYQLQQNSITHDANWFSNTWDGCLEERKAMTSITATTTAIPSGSYDLDFDTLPNGNTDTQFPPFDPDTAASASGSQSSCPGVAKPLQAWTRSDMQTYMNSLSALGGTLSDTGMIWAGRLLSTTGLWASLNPTTYGNMPVNRFVILMTDGAITAYRGYYAAYGTENLDHRIESTYPSSCGGNGYYSGTSLCDADSYIHRTRFSMACNEIKNAGTSIWVIGFGASFANVASSDDLAALQNCASNAGQASNISDSSSLVAKFTAIGQAIGSLRLTH